MRTFLVGALCICSCKLPEPPTEPLGPANLSGKVELVSSPLVGEATRFTRPGVKIILEGLYTNVTQTDADGAYRFEGVPPGRYTLRASFGEFTREGEVSAPIEALPDSEITAPALALTPAGAIAGRARLGGREEGNLGIRVSVDGTDIVTTTDDSGAFVLNRVPLGSHRVRVEKPDYGGRTKRGIEVHFAETTLLEPLDIQLGIFSDFNNPPEFWASEIVVIPGQIRPETLLQPLPLDLGPEEVARFDTVRLEAWAEDKDGDRLTYFWSVTAGSLDRTDAPEVLWTVDDADALAATVTVRVVDERSGAAYLSRQLTIVNVQALSARMSPGHITYSYRPFSGTWRVLDYSMSSRMATRVGELDSLDDPKPMRLGERYAATPFTDGERGFVVWTKGEAPAAKAFAGTGAIEPVAERAVRMEMVDGMTRARIYDPAGDSVKALFDCGMESCGEIATIGDDKLIISITRDAGDEVIVHGHDVSSGASFRFVRSANTGGRIRSDGKHLAFSNVPPGYERGLRNDILRATLPHGATTELYAGLYEVFLGAYDGRYVGFTEQEYRVVYSPEKAYVWDAGRNIKTNLDPAESFAHDEVLGFGHGQVVVRRYPRADWLEDEQRTHYELCIRQLPP